MYDYAHPTESQELRPTITLSSKDYQEERTTITFSSTVSTMSVPVNTFGDSKYEPTENFLVRLEDPQSQTGVSIDLDAATANVDIINNDSKYNKMNN